VSGVAARLECVDIVLLLLGVGECVRVFGGRLVNIAVLLFMSADQSTQLTNQQLPHAATPGSTTSTSARGRRVRTGR
jgi:hypothetical protein